MRSSTNFPPLTFACLALLLASCGSGGDNDAGERPDDGVPIGVLPADCGDVTIARMTWDSAETIAEIDRFILEEGFGCEATLVDGDTLPTFTSMAERGEPDMAPALWFESLRPELEASVAAGDLVLGARTLRDGGREGWWVTGAFAEAHPDIRSIEDALVRPELFAAAAQGGSAAFHTCPSNWNCSVTGENLFRAYGADAMGFVLVEPDSAADVDAAPEGAAERGEEWLGYYWSPTVLAGRLDMRLLDAPPHDPAEWERCTSRPDCPDPQPNGYPSSEVRVVVTDDFAAKAAVAMDYVGRRGWDHETVNAVLAWIADNGASAEEAAIHFLENFEDVWSEWVDAATAARVKAAL